MNGTMRKKLRIWRNAGKIAAHYRRWPYSFWKVDKYDDFNHEHTCFLTRLANVDLSEVCPFAEQKHGSSEITDECERCRYFGKITYERDPETGAKQVCFIGDRRFLIPFEGYIPEASDE